MEKNFPRFSSFCLPFALASKHNIPFHIHTEHAVVCSMHFFVPGPRWTLVCRGVSRGVACLCVEWLVQAHFQQRGAGTWEGFYFYLCHCSPAAAHTAPLGPGPGGWGGPAQGWGALLRTEGARCGSLCLWTTLQQPWWGCKQVRLHSRVWH